MALQERWSCPDFPAEVLDAYLRAWDASEEHLKSDYQTKREIVSHVLFDEEELSIGDGYRSEAGSYWLRKSSNNPTELIWWKKCDVYSFLENTQTRITCYLGFKELFQMNATAGEFTYAYLGTLHDPKGQNGYEGDTAFVEHGKCKAYYP